jgi:hypothetical protein
MQLKIIAPAPWTLTGSGFVLLYRFPAGFINQYGQMADYQLNGFKGLIGAVMLVDYKASDVGPYQELLFIPGMFKLANKWAFSISKIYVSTYESLWNGVENWGIPKELADFQISYNGSETIFETGLNQKTFFKAAINDFGMKFPISTQYLPTVKIVQQWKSGLLQTSPQAKGSVRFCKLMEIKADPLFFPPLDHVKPLLCLSIKDFSMIFPVARILK